MYADSDIKIILNNNLVKNKNTKILNLVSLEETKQVRKFHKSIPEYTVTPLHSLSCLSKSLKVKNIWIKDESFRFGLNAFKVLGGVFAIAKYISSILNIDLNTTSYNDLKKEIIEKGIENSITFITATDGNHGRGVAWAARQFKQKSIVYMPKGSSEIRLGNIKKEGAEASITVMNYDDTVRFANIEAQGKGYVVIQDTAWEGYEDIPSWIMQGYSTIIDEVLEQLEIMNEKIPSHIILQAEVGSFAGSIAGYMTSKFKEKRPYIIIIEPHNAACIYLSAEKNDEKPHSVKGDLNTIMAGLACGDPNYISWDILKNYGDAYVSCSDYITEEGMRILCRPLEKDPQITSGESGAVGIGFINEILKNKKYKNVKKLLRIDETSSILAISTEGDTDPENYKKITQK